MSTAPLLIAHRGMSRQFPENTMPAFEAAIAAGADMIELDISLASDGHFVVIHDDTLKRTTGNAGFVASHTSHEISAMDAGEWFGEQHRGTAVPTLDELLGKIAGRIPLNIEIKPFFSLDPVGRMQEALSRLIGEISARALQEQVILSSSNFFILDQLRRLDSSLRLGMIFSQPPLDYAPEEVCDALDIYSLHPWHVQTSAELVDSMHGCGVKVYPYTVNELPLLQRLMAMGVDGVFTDIADELKRELAAL